MSSASSRTGSPRWSGDALKAVAFTTWSWMIGRSIGWLSVSASSLSAFHMDRKSSSPTCPNGTSFSSIKSSHLDLLVSSFPEMMASIRTLCILATASGVSKNWQAIASLGSLLASALKCADAFSKSNALIFNTFLASNSITLSSSRCFVNPNAEEKDRSSFGLLLVGTPRQIMLFKTANRGWTSS